MEGSGFLDNNIVDSESLDHIFRKNNMKHTYTHIYIKQIPVYIYTCVHIYILYELAFVYYIFI
jgi:hypothetical protein